MCAVQALTERIENLRDEHKAIVEHAIGVTEDANICDNSV
jgi:hypothetical protein